MKNNNKHGWFFRWAYKSLKYLLIGSIGFIITYTIPKIFDLEIITFDVFAVFAGIVLRLGITMLLMLGIGTVYESWR